MLESPYLIPTSHQSPVNICQAAYATYSRRYSVVAFLANDLPRKDGIGAIQVAEKYIREQAVSDHGHFSWLCNVLKSLQ